MKTYRVPVGDKTFTLSGLTDEVKRDIEDIVQANERMALHRQLTKGLLSPDCYAMEKQGIQAITFASEAVIKYLSSPTGKLAFYRVLLEHGGKAPIITTEDVKALIDCVDADGESAQIVRGIWEDAYPKAKKPTDSMESVGVTNSEKSS